MGEMTHKATRAAFGAAISIALKHMNKDREKGLLGDRRSCRKIYGRYLPKIIL